MNTPLQRLAADFTLSGKLSLSRLFNRFYWLQIVLIAAAVILGIACSALIVKNLLIKTAMEQEDAHYWQRYEKNHNAELPDTKNLYGYRWRETPPPELAGQTFQPGVHRLFIDGKEHVTNYNVHDGNHLLLVFGESNVNRLIWIFGLAPLMASLILLYSMLWWVNRQAHRHLSPVTQLAQALQQIDLTQPKQSKLPFDQIKTLSNIEADELKLALQTYHQTLIEFIEREQQFTAEVSHELRTPLSVIKGGLELLNYKYPDDTTLPRMQNVVREMQQLMDTLLTLARQGSAQLTLQPLDLAALMQQSCEDLADVFSARQMDYDIKVLHPNHVLTNPTLVSMIFGNLLRNALNYSQGKRVYILIDAARIVIEDDGIGISPETLDAIRAGQSASSHIPHKGFGIGLKLVKRLCQMLGWQIELINKASLNNHALIMQSNEGLAVVIYTGG